MCVCVRERERGRNREKKSSDIVRSKVNERKKSTES